MILTGCKVLETSLDLAKTKINRWEGIKQAAEKQEANKAANEALIDQMHKDSQELNKNVHDQEWVQDFLNELHSGE